MTRSAGFRVHLVEDIIVRLGDSSKITQVPVKLGVMTSRPSRNRRHDQVAAVARVSGNRELPFFSSLRIRANAMRGLRIGAAG